MDYRKIFFSIVQNIDDVPMWDIDGSVSHFYKGYKARRYSTGDIRMFDVKICSSYRELTSDEAKVVVGRLFGEKSDAIFEG